MADERYGVWVITTKSCGWVISINRNKHSLVATYEEAAVAIEEFKRKNYSYIYSIRKHKPGCSGEYDFNKNESCCLPIETREEISNLIKALEL